MKLFSSIELIPFGWGQNEDSNSVQDPTNKDGNNFIVETDRATLKDDEVYAGNPNHMDFDDSNPHLVMAAEMIRDDEMEDTNISKDVYDDSQRYSNVDRPSLSIKHSSPLPTRHGSFEDPSEKIANLFRV